MKDYANLRSSLSKSTFFSPVMVTVISVLGFAILFSFLKARELGNLEERVATESERVATEIRLSLETTSKAMQRYTGRVAYLGVVDRTYLDLDSHAYLDHIPLLKRIGLIDTDYKVFWSYPNDLESQVKDFDQSQVEERRKILDKVRTTGIPALSRALQLRSGGIGFLFPFPLLRKGRFAGFVYTTIQADQLFHSFAPSIDFHVTISEDGKRILETKNNEPIRLDLPHKVDLNWNGTNWSVEVTPTNAYVEKTRSPVPYIVFSFGVLLSLLTGKLLQDLKVRKHSQTKLMLTTERMRRIIEATGEGIWEREYTPSGRVIFIDDQALKVYGFSMDKSPTYEDLAAKIEPSDRVLVSEALANHFREDSDNFEVEFRILKNAEQEIYRWLRARGKIVKSAGEVPVLISTIRDVTEEVERREKLQHALIDAKLATKAKSDFLANMSHEIRTPLNGIIGLTSLLSDTPLVQSQKHYVDTLAKSAQTLLALINDILDFSKIEAGKFELEVMPFDLKQLVQHIVDLSKFEADRKSLKISMNVSNLTDQVMFRGDPKRITQILFNLVGNAIKFTKEGSVVISLTQISVSDQGSLLRIDVTDTGIGISEANQARLFQPFVQADSSTSRRFGGTGLGLSISKHLAELMGGNVGVHSELNKGSTFWFTLTMKQVHQPLQIQAPNALVRSELDALPKLKILLAEDIPTNRLIAVKMLEKNGFEVHPVCDGQEALIALSANQFDLILMDCQMPVLDGYSATRAIRANPDLKIANIPIVAMTANAMTGDRELCLEAGMDAYFTKPFKVGDLINVIHQTYQLKITAPTKVS